MFESIALPIQAPDIPSDGVRCFLYRGLNGWQETMYFDWCLQDKEILRACYTSAESDDPDAWEWTSFLFFPESWPPDVLDQYVWTDGMQLAFLP